MSSLDAMLVNLTLQGDHNAFGRLMEHHRPSLLNLALSQVGNLSEAEDLVQEAFIQAYQHLDTLQAPDRFAGWIYSITRNLCYAALRKQRLKPDPLEDSNATDIPDSSVTPDSLAEGHEVSDTIVKAVETLPPNNQRVFLLYLEGWSYRNIATTLRLSISTVSGRVQQAKRQVKEKLSDEPAFVASIGPLQIERGYLREEIYRMSEEILKSKALGRRILGIESEYDFQVEHGGVKPLSKEDVVGYIFREILSGRMYPDVFLENGARFYQDRGCLPEYATPECDNLVEVLTHEKAGERILQRLFESALKKIQADGFTQRISVYKNGSGTCGCHENYLMDSRVNDDQLASQLIPFLATRQIFTGVGKVKPTTQGKYTLSQRAEYIRKEITADSNVRGIINLRDAKIHADATKYRRLHVTAGDNNMSEFATYLKVGTTEIVVCMLEDSFIGNELALRDPVDAVHQISADTTCKQKVELVNGKLLSAIEIQREYLELAKRYFNQKELDPTTKSIMEKWEDVLNRLGTDPIQLARELDWVIKKKLIDVEIDSQGLVWDSDEVAELDRQYHNIQPEIGLYHKLLKEGCVEQIVTDEEIEQAMHQPPENTRAQFRSKFVKRANERKVLCGVDWSYIQLYEPYQKLFLMHDPLQSEFQAENLAPEDFPQAIEAHQAGQKQGTQIALTHKS